MSIFNRDPHVLAEVLLIKGDKHYGHWRGDATCRHCVQERVVVPPEALCEAMRGVLVHYRITEADTYYLIVTRQRRSQDDVELRADVEIKVSEERTRVGSKPRLPPSLPPSRRKATPPSSGKPRIPRQESPACFHRKASPPSTVKPRLPPQCPYGSPASLLNDPHLPPQGIPTSLLKESPPPSSRNPHLPPQGTPTFLLKQSPPSSSNNPRLPPQGIPTSLLKQSPPPSSNNPHLPPQESPPPSSGIPTWMRLMFTCVLGR